MHRYIPEHEQQSILTESHGGFVCGHYAGKATANKILRAGLQWPTIDKDAK